MGGYETPGFGAKRPYVTADDVRSWGQSRPRGYERRLPKLTRLGHRPYLRVRDTAIWELESGIPAPVIPRAPHAGVTDDQLAPFSQHLPKKLLYHYFNTMEPRFRV